MFVRLCLCNTILYTWFGKKWKRFKKFWGWKICLVYAYFFKHLSLSMLINFMLIKKKSVLKTLEFFLLLLVNVRGMKTIVKLWKEYKNFLNLFWRSCWGTKSFFEMSPGHKNFFNWSKPPFRSNSRP